MSHGTSIGHKPAFGPRSARDARAVPADQMYGRACRHRSERGQDVGELEAVVRQMFEGLDKGDADSAVATLAEDAQGIDEISRRWMRDENDGS